MPPHLPPDFDALLRGVSRSFYLSIRLLPARLRLPVALAYLLARATDTVADTSSVRLAERIDFLEALALAIDRAAGTDTLGARPRAFAASQTDASERALILRLPQALQALHRLDPDDLAHVQVVLRHIVRGQRLDLAHFPHADAIRALPDAAALNEYTYLVAGSVGEFWTDLCLRHVRDYADLPAARMRALGRSFGCGLQLVNIVRDAGADLAMGRCYFPADELAGCGIAPQDLASSPGAFLAVSRRWQAQAAWGMRDGMSYALAVRPRRARAAVALPALLGVRTLALVGSAGADALVRRVKMPRREVHAVLARTVLSLAGRRGLQAQFDRMRGRPSASEWDNPAR